MLEAKAFLSWLGIYKGLAVVFVAWEATKIIKRHMNEAIRAVNCCVQALLGGAFAHSVHETLLKRATSFQADLQNPNFSGQPQGQCCANFCGAGLKLQQLDNAFLALWWCQGQVTHAVPPKSSMSPWLRGPPIW